MLFHLLSYFWSMFERIVSSFSFFKCFILESYHVVLPKAGLFVILFVGLIFGFSREVAAATIAAASCSQSDVQVAINSSQGGDTVSIPEGNCTWGDSATYLNVNKAIVLQGAGRDATIIGISATAGSWTSGTIRINAAATVRSFTIRTGTSGNSGTAFSAGVNGFRITDIEYLCQTTTVNGYFVYAGAYGVIDNCSVTGGSGSDELIFARGPTDSWQTNDSIGGADNLFIENNTFGGSGYVCDINSNGRAVVRYNTINGANKVDGHGKASNSPPRGVRHMEVYNNHWTYTSSVFWTAIEMRGGTGTVFNNVADASGSGPWFHLTDYGYTAAWSNFGGVCQCPSDYPVDDQIGVGQDPKMAASDPMYIWNNTRGGQVWPLSWHSTSSCVATCGTFVLQDVIQENTDYFSIQRPGYISYDCPHPLTGLSGSCNSEIAGVSGYNIDSSPFQGDLNSDGTVNIFDYNLLLTNFGNATCGNVADINTDCTVNIFDYNIMLTNFGQSG